ncbi:hypothetical protein WJX73_008657 [Symbiochloris irregularis]|uniref:Uncharacterized protein n=1 Tax=Symbiochloris irregularis TaxID=706552 RepID=A0AAW1NZ07_9CHLO
MGVASPASAADASRTKARDRSGNNARQANGQGSRHQDASDNSVGTVNSSLLATLEREELVARVARLEEDIKTREKSVTDLHKLMKQERRRHAETREDKDHYRRHHEIVGARASTLDEKGQRFPTRIQCTDPHTGFGAHWRAVPAQSQQKSAAEAVTPGAAPA